MLSFLQAFGLGTSVHMWIAIIVFLFVISCIIFEWIDKTVAVLAGVSLLAISSTIEYTEIISFIDFKTILLLMGLMILVSIVEQSNVLEWLNVKIIKTTQGNPYLLYIVFGLITLVLSTFLANATTMMILIPLTITLTKGMGLNPKPYIIAEIIFSDVGGTLTIIGDPANVMISAATQMGFIHFMNMVYIPLSIITVLYVGILSWLNWNTVKPIGKSLTKLFITNMLISKLEHQFSKCAFHKKFAAITISIFSLTIIGIVINFGNIPIEYIAITGGIILLITSRKYIHAERIFEKIDMHTLLFFAGLFIIVGALEKVGALHYVSHFIIQHSTTTLGVSLLVLWTVGLLSAFIENIPLVAMMIPVLDNAIGSGIITGNTEIVWFALSFGACLGGNGSLMGSSANILGAQLATKQGVKISFKEYFAIGYPLTILSLIVCSIYIYFVV